MWHPDTVLCYFCYFCCGGAVAHVSCWAMLGVRWAVVPQKWEESANAATAAAADAVIAAVDVDAVVKTLAARVAADDSEAKAAKAKATSAKAALIDALYRKARSQAGFLGIRSNAGKSSATAAADSAATDADADQPAAGAGAGAGAGSDASASATTQQEAFTATAKELAKWTDLGKTHPLIAIEQHIVAEEYGSALAAINAALKQGQVRWGLFATPASALSTHPLTHGAALRSLPPRSCRCASGSPCVPPCGRPSALSPRRTATSGRWWLALRPPCLPSAKQLRVRRLSSCGLPMMAVAGAGCVRRRGQCQ